MRWRESDLPSAVRAGIAAFAAVLRRPASRARAPRAFLEKRRAALRGAALKIRAVTVDFWGTLLLDPPSSDNRYKRRRMADFETILAGLGVKVTPIALDRAYEDSGRLPRAACGRRTRTCR